ncbi:DNA helicase rad5, partial [Basidiobolus ranarum]
LEDLFSLVRFLRFEPWCYYSFWRQFITIPFEKKDVNALNVVQSILEPLVLRRQKSTLGTDGKPIVELPEKKIDIEYIEFSPQEQDVYDRYEVKKSFVSIPCFLIFSIH